MPDIPIGQTDTNEAVFFIPMIEASLGPETITFQGFLDHTAIGIVAENIVSLTHYPPGLLKDMAVLYFCSKRYGCPVFLLPLVTDIALTDLLSE
jgi:hypothetical protein